MNNFEKNIRKNRLTSIAPKYCFDATLADFEQITNNGFMQLEKYMIE